MNQAALLLLSIPCVALLYFLFTIQYFTLRKYLYPIRENHNTYFLVHLSNR